MRAKFSRLEQVRIPISQEKRRKVWAYYDEILSNIPEVTIPAKASEDSRHGLFTYSIKARDRNDLARISHRYFDFLSFELLQRPLLLIKDALKAIVSNNLRIDRHLILYLGSFAALESMTEPFGQAR